MSFEGNRKGRATWWSMQESRRSWFSLAKSSAANEASAAAVPRMLKSNTGRIKSVNSGNS